jgi:hypothetical protein
MAGCRPSRHPRRAKTSTWCWPSSGSRPAFRPSFRPKMLRSASLIRRFSSPPPRVWALVPRGLLSSKTRPPVLKPPAAPEWPASGSDEMAHPSPRIWPFPPSPTSLPTPSPAFWILCSAGPQARHEFPVVCPRTTVYNWREGADKSSVPRISLHVWGVLTSACYRYGVGTRHILGSHRG